MLYYRLICLGNGGLKKEFCTGGLQYESSQIRFLKSTLPSEAAEPAAESGEEKIVAEQTEGKVETGENVEKKETEVKTEEIEDDGAKESSKRSREDPDFSLDSVKRSRTASGPSSAVIKLEKGKAVHTCEFCSRTFERKDTYINHVRNHTGEKPYACKFCGKAFSRSFVLNKHEKIHLKKGNVRTRVSPEDLYDQLLEPQVELEVEGDGEEQMTLAGEPETEEAGDALEGDEDVDPIKLEADIDIKEEPVDYADEDTESAADSNNFNPSHFLSIKVRSYVYLADTVRNIWHNFAS